MGIPFQMRAYFNNRRHFQSNDLPWMKDGLIAALSVYRDMEIVYLQVGHNDSNHVICSQNLTADPAYLPECLVNPGRT
jgi:hypothetical protein